MPQTAYVIQVGDQTSGTRAYRWSAPSELYGNLLTELGITPEATYAGSDIQSGAPAGRFLPRLRIILKSATAGEADKSALVFCDPGNLETALFALKGKTANGRTISRVVIPKRRVFI